MLAGFKSYLNITSVAKIYVLWMFFSPVSFLSKATMKDNELLSFLPQTEQTVTFHRRLASESQAGGTLLWSVFILGEKKKSVRDDGRGKYHS